MLKISNGSAKLLSKLVMVAQASAALFFGYLWATRRNQVVPMANQVPDKELYYTDDTINAYAAMAISCALLAVLMLFIRKSKRLMTLFVE